MSDTPNRLQEQQGPVDNRKPTTPEAAGPLSEDLNAATKHPEAPDPRSDAGMAEPRTRLRGAEWSEVHYPMNGSDGSVDPRATGDPIGNEQG